MENYRKNWRLLKASIFILLAQHIKWAFINDVTHLEGDGVWQLGDMWGYWRDRRKEGVSGNRDIFVTSFTNAPLTRGILKQVGLKERNGIVAKKN